MMKSKYSLLKEDYIKLKVYFTCFTSNLCKIKCKLSKSLKLIRSWIWECWIIDGRRWRLCTELVLSLIIAEYLLILFYTQLVRDWVRRFIDQNYFLLNATNFEIVGLILSKSWHFNRYVRGRNKKDLFIIFISIKQCCYLLA